MLDLTPKERELLLTQTAAVRERGVDDDETGGPTEVLLTPSMVVLCTAEPKHARLIKKLFNGGLG